jgi:AcrR family transcriptional regulator
MPGSTKKRAGRPQGADSEETRARIIAGAVRCFAQSGYSKTSNQDIARAAGITTGAIYHYFDSKAELFAAVGRHVESAFLGLYGKAFSEEGSCVEQLCAGLEAAAELSRERPELAHFASLAPVEVQRHPELQGLVATGMQDLRGFFRELIGHGDRSGDVAEDVDIDTVTNVVISSFFGLAWMRAEIERDEDYDRLLHGFQRLLRGTLFRS